MVTTPIPAGTPFSFSDRTVGLQRDTGDACFIAATNGPPHRIDGYSVGLPIITQDPPHKGEMHPDGDELLYIISGRFDVVLELDTGDRNLELQPGDGLVVPRGVWHLITMQEPGQMLHITPGPRGEARH